MSSLGFKKFVQMLGFVAMVLFMIAIILAKFVPSISAICNLIATLIGLFVIVIVAFMYVKGKRNPIFFAIFAVCLIVIIVMYCI